MSVPSVSLDGIVGGQSLAFLLRQQSLEDLVRTQGVTYVVTHDAFAYRPIFKDTPLVALYEHDLHSAVGERVQLGRMIFEKVLTNSSFADPSRYRWQDWPGLNVGTAVRVYAEPGSPWDGSLLMWNSVYRVTVGG